MSDEKQGESLPDTVEDPTGGELPQTVFPDDAEVGDELDQTPLDLGKEDDD